MHFHPPESQDAVPPQALLRQMFSSGEKACEDAVDEIIVHVIQMKFLQMSACAIEEYTPHISCQSNDGTEEALLGPASDSLWGQVRR